MRVRYGSRVISLTREYEKALISYMKAECKLLKSKDRNDTDNDWYWGRCHITDLQINGGLSFSYGDKKSLPDDSLGRFGIVAILPDE